MDIITQGLAAGALAQTISSSATLRRATLVGLVTGLAPDLDVFINSPDDPLLQLEFHRSFSHALISAPFAGLLIAALLYWLLPAAALRRGPLRFWQLAAVATLGFASGGLLDACTSFGTQLLWPFNEQRVAWNIIAIVDPLFSLTLALGVFFAWRWRRPTIAALVVLLALAYLALGAWQRERAETVIAQLAAQRGHAIEASVVKPTLANIVLWRSVYQAAGRYHIDAVRVAFDARVFPGSSLPMLRPTADFPELQLTSTSYRDLQRFAHLSDGFLVHHPTHDDVVGDIRYAMLPDSIEPLWGIQIDTTQPRRHTPLVFFRRFGKPERRHFLSLLFNNSRKDD